MDNKQLLYDLIDEFRIWNREWKTYDRVIKIKTKESRLEMPKDVDEFIEKLNKKYKIEKL